MSKSKPCHTGDASLVWMLTKTQELKRCRSSPSSFQVVVFNALLLGNTEGARKECALSLGTNMLGALLEATEETLIREACDQAAARAWDLQEAALSSVVCMLSSPPGAPLKIHRGGCASFHFDHGFQILSRT